MSVEIRVLNTVFVFNKVASLTEKLSEIGKRHEQITLLEVGVCYWPMAFARNFFSASLVALLCRLTSEILYHEYCKSQWENLSV